MRQQGSSRSSGQTLVEFALMVPLIMYLLFGLADVGRAVYNYNVLSNAVREGAREAVLAYNQCGNTAPGGTGCSTPPAGGNTNLVGVEPGISRAGGGLIAFDFTDSGYPNSSSPNGGKGKAPACTLQPNHACVWIFIAEGTGSACASPTGVLYGPNPPPSGTDHFGTCDFNPSKQGGNHNVVVEAEFKFVPFTPLIGSVMGNSLVFWAKSEMRTEY